MTSDAPQVQREKLPAAPATTEAQRTVPGDIVEQRLRNQHIGRQVVRQPGQAPGQAVAWMGAVQAQDYFGALWAVGLRAGSATAGDIEGALAGKAIVRTWLLRGTLHFAAAGDVRWLRELAAPRVIARLARRHRELELDDAAFARSREVLVAALEGGGRLARDAAYRLLDAAGISTAGQRGIHILQQLALEGILCFGPRQGKQHTFVLLEDWAPAAKPMARDEALAELARRYFTSRGPATLQDFVWWSGLAPAGARAGLAGAGPHLVQEVIGGRTYWLAPETPTAEDASPAALLLPPFDEYTIAYANRSAVLAPEHASAAISGNGIARPAMVFDGQVVGTWTRALRKGSVVISLRPFGTIGEAERQAFAAAARRYGAFLGLPAVLA